MYWRPVAQLSVFRFSHSDLTRHKLRFGRTRRTWRRASHFGTWRTSPFQRCDVQQSERTGWLWKRQKKSNWMMQFRSHFKSRTYILMFYRFTILSDPVESDVKKNFWSFRIEMNQIAFVNFWYTMWKDNILSGSQEVFNNIFCRHDYQVSKSYYILLTVWGYGRGQLYNQIGIFFHCIQQEFPFQSVNENWRNYDIVFDIPISCHCEKWFCSTRILRSRFMICKTHGSLKYWKDDSYQWQACQLHPPVAHIWLSAETRNCLSRRQQSCRANRSHSK